MDSLSEKYRVGDGNNGGFTEVRGRFVPTDQRVGARALIGPGPGEVVRLVARTVLFVLFTADFLAIVLGGQTPEGSTLAVVAGLIMPPLVLGIAALAPRQWRADCTPACR